MMGVFYKLFYFTFFLFLLISINPAAAQPDCDCNLGEENICELGECDDPIVCCQVVTVPVNSKIYYLIIAAAFLAVFSVFKVKKSTFHKFQYSALQKMSRKIRRFF